MKKEKRAICMIHQNIQELAKEIINMRPRNYETVEEALNEARFFAEQIFELCDDALDAGQRMEARLQEYRNAIEDLGFMRKGNETQ